MLIELKQEIKPHQQHQNKSKTTMMDNMIRQFN